MDIFEAISEGLHDDDLDAIIKAAKARTIKVPLAVGDKIQINDTVSPQYMRGTRGTIKGLAGTKKGQPLYTVQVDQHDFERLQYTRYLSSTGTTKLMRSLIIKLPTEE